jgi:hypothetical protein
MTGGLDFAVARLQGRDRVVAPAAAFHGRELASDGCPLHALREEANASGADDENCSPCLFRSAALFV